MTWQELGQGSSGEAHVQKNKVAGATLEHVKEDNRKGKKLLWEKIAESV